VPPFDDLFRVKNYALSTGAMEERGDDVAEPVRMLPEEQMSRVSEHHNVSTRNLGSNQACVAWV